MTMKLILCIFLASVVTLRSESYQCGENEESRCDYTCEKSCVTLDILIKCVSDVECRCFCKQGYVRAYGDGKCIRLSDCPTCAVNETYKASGIDCQTCTNYQVVRCAVIDERRCYCLPGYVRDETTGFCKSPEDCPEDSEVQG